jgi:hypothetical protein
MSIEIDLAPEIEKSYAEQAAAQGGPLSEYLRQVLEEQATPPAKKLLTPAERAAYWRESAGGLSHSALLSDEAISRKSIYSSRG